MMTKRSITLIVLFLLSASANAQIIGGGLLSAGGGLPLKLQPVAYYESSHGIHEDAGSINAWDDLSGNGRDLAQATPSKQPAIVANVLNGRPAVRFDGSDDYLNASFSAVSQPLTIFVVCMIGGNNQIAFDGNSTRCYLFRTAGGLDQIYAGASLVHSAGDTSYHIWSCVFDGATSLIRKDGTEQMGNAGSGSLTGLCLGIYGGDKTSYPLDGDILAIAIYDRALSAAQIGQVEAFFQSVYALSP